MIRCGMMRTAFWLCFLAMVVTSTSALAQEDRVIIKGRPAVLDGDTLLFPARDLPPLPEGYSLREPNDAVRVRLWGIDAPEMQDWPLGAYARANLADLVRDKDVTCEVVRKAEPVVDRTWEASVADLAQRMKSQSPDSAASVCWERYAALASS